MVALLLLIAAAVLVTVLVALCAAGRIPANSGVGIRLPSTRSSEAGWRAGHRAALPASAASGGAVVLICVVGLAVPRYADVLTAAATVVLVLGLLVAALLAHRAASATTGR